MPRRRGFEYGGRHHSPNPGEEHDFSDRVFDREAYWRTAALTSSIIAEDTAGHTSAARLRIRVRATERPW